MKWKVAGLAALMLAIGSFVTSVRADTLVKVTVRAAGGDPVPDVAVAVGQVAGYAASPEGDISPPAVVGAGVTGSDGTVSIRLSGVRSADVYDVTADQAASGRQASTAVFAADGHWPAPTLTLGDPSAALNLERSAAGRAAASCDQTAYATHVQRIREAIAQKGSALAALENAIVQYARASGLQAADLGAARLQLAAARQQPGSAAVARAAVLQHYVLLRVLADNVRAGLEVDRANDRSIAALELCSDQPQAGVEMRARCPPGWQTAQQTAQSAGAPASCHQRSPGFEPDRN